MTDDRAVSDALGFVFVFGIIIVTVGVVYVGGFNSIDNARQYERMNNAERAFEVFADNVEDITQRGAPSRATEIKLDEAALEGGSVQSITVNVTRHDTGTNDGWRFNRTITTEYQPVVYESQTDTSNRMVYALGGTFRASSGGTVMSEEPAWILDEDRVIVPVIQTVHEDDKDVVGSKTVLVRTEQSTERVLVDNTTHSSDVYINVTSPRAAAWANYMEAQSSSVSCATRSGTWGESAECELLDVETVYLTRIRIKYQFL